MFYREGLLAPRPTPKLEDQPLSAFHDCLFNLFAATLHKGGRSSIRNLKTRHAVVTGTHYTWTSVTLNFIIWTHRILNAASRQRSRQTRLGYWLDDPRFHFRLGSRLCLLHNVQRLWVPPRLPFQGNGISGKEVQLKARLHLQPSLRMNGWMNISAPAI